MRRRVDRPSRIAPGDELAAALPASSLAALSGGGPDGDSMPALRRACQRLQLALLAAQQEQERTERLLGAQARSMMRGWIGALVGPSGMGVLLRVIASDLLLCCYSSSPVCCPPPPPLQTTIAKDLGAEVASLSTRLATETQTLTRRLSDTETLAEKRLQRMHLLEAQVLWVMGGEG